LLFTIFYLPDLESCLYFLFKNFHHFQVMMSHVLKISDCFNYYLLYIDFIITVFYNMYGFINFQNHMHFILTVIYFCLYIIFFCYVNCSLSTIRNVDNHRNSNLLWPLDCYNLIFSFVKFLGFHISPICFFAIFLFIFANHF
jgi:hypothetical protein